MQCAESREHRLPARQPARAEEIIYLIDDDPNVLEGLAELLDSVGKRTMCFGTAREYLSHQRVDSTACLVLDLMLPDMDGIELQQHLAAGACPPIIFMSGHADVRSTVRAMKGGAVEFLTKPISKNALVVAIEAALLEDKRRRSRHLEMMSLRNRYSLLTARERQVFALVTEGLLNKQAASVLGITEVTLQVHRSQVMRKMEAGSLASLVRMATALGVFPLEPAPVCTSGLQDGGGSMYCTEETGSKGGKLLPFRRSREIVQV